MLDKEIKEFADQEGFIYVCNDDTISHPFEEPPIIVNYFSLKNKTFFQYVEPYFPSLLNDQ